MPDVIADTSPLQYLHRLALLDVLHHIYGTVIVPAAVARELEAGERQGAAVPNISTLQWVRLESAPGGSNQQIATSLGRGERDAICLALQKPDPLLLLDDRDARREASRLAIRFTGVLGILLRAKQDGIVREVAPLLDDLERAGFYLDGATRTRALQLAGETP